MENQNTNSFSYKLGFHGKGSEYFGVIIVNWLLTVITLGIYYPWAKARQLQFIYGSTSLNDDRFSFHGTGAEMFRGFIKTIFIFLVLFAILLGFTYLQMPFVGLIVFYLLLFAIVPIAIHGSYRYRMSRTSWRGIRFGYRGEKTTLLLNFFKWAFFTIITLGIYSAWLSVNLRNYVMSNVRFGSAKLKSDADGTEYFIIILKGYFLTIITLGIYLFWWQKKMFAFYVDNLSLEKDEQKISFKSTATAGGFFKLLIVNLLIVVFTLGLGYAWAVTRTMNFVANSIELNGNIDLDTLSQTEENITDATGEDMADFLDIDFI
jgi:uncharacterized membrane protein YjgN (DUF898 family)